MKIKVVSDIHLEFSAVSIKNDANYDVLILGGDIMVAEDLHDYPEWHQSHPYQMPGPRQLAAQRYRAFLREVSQEFPNVVYIAGNHELYRGKWIGGIQTLREECAKYPNIHFLDCDTVVLSGVAFIGATLWTDMNRRDPITMHAIKAAMNDYHVIRNDARSFAPLTPTDTVHRHSATLEYFSKSLEEHKDKPCVVVGHHLPSSLSTHPSYKNEHITNGAYRSDLSEFILSRPQIKLWTAGHTHTPHRYYMGSTLVVCNPRGYVTNTHTENESWNPDRYVDLNNMPTQEEVDADWSWSQVCS